jgi:uncharacterized membrane protein
MMTLILSFTGCGKSKDKRLISKTTDFLDAPVYMYAEPSTESEIIMDVRGGLQVFVTGPDQNGWRPVQRDYKDGYIDSSYLTRPVKDTLPFGNTFLFFLIWTISTLVIAVIGRLLGFIPYIGIVFKIVAVLAIIIIWTGFFIHIAPRADWWELAVFGVLALGDGTTTGWIIFIRS